MPIIFGILFPCTDSQTLTITLPIGMFPDHPNLTAFFACAQCAWFINNRWYEVMYYAVARSHTLQTASHNCQVAGDCLTVDGGTGLPASPGIRALVGLTGYSLNGQNRPNSNLADYLDSDQNRDASASAFEQRTAGRGFNDRFFAISYY
jgi:hypothetical protein